jgi:biopolymer transport protein ExbD
MQKPSLAEGLLVILVFIISLSASANSAIENDLKNLCKSYATQEQKDLLGAEQDILERAKNETSSEEVAKIINHIENQTFFRGLYDSTVAEIKKETGLDWTCSSMENFYSISFTALDQKEEKAYAMVVHKDKSITINSETFPLEEFQSLNLEKQFKVKPDKIEIHLNFEFNQSDMHKIQPVLDKLSADGVERINLLIDQD